MTTHEELVTELPRLEKLSNAARLKHAKKRRQKQLKKFQEQLRLDRQTVGASLKKRTPQKINFEEGALLCDFVSRNDIIGAEKILKQGVEPNISNADGLTPLHKCCIDNSVDMAELLLEYGADLNSRDIEGWTPLHAAAATGNVQLISILVDQGANLVAINHDDNMPVDVAADSDIKYILQQKMTEAGNTEDMIEYLHKSVPVTMLADLKDSVRNNRDINVMDKYGATALHIAAANGYQMVLDFLLSLEDIDLDVQDNEGWTPFMAAVCWNQKEAMEKLASKGADMDMKNLRGETAYVIAEDPETRQYILDLRGQYGQSQEINLEEMEESGEICRRPRRMSVKRTRQQDKEGLAKQSAQAEAELRKKSLAAEDIQKALLHMDPKVLKDVMADDGVDEKVLAIAHTPLIAQDSVLSTLSDFGDEPASPNDIIVQETIEEESEDLKGERGNEEEGGELQKRPPVRRLHTDSGSTEEVELKESNHVGERKGNGVKETNVDENKPLSPIEKKLSRQEIFNNDQNRPTVKRNRFTTQRDPFHKDRAPRKSVLKRTAHPPSPVTTFESSSPSTSPTGNGKDDDDEDDEISKHQQQMDRKCCVVM